MNDIVVDTNVWVAAGKSIDGVQTIEEVECIERCVEWMRCFLKGDDKLLVDFEWKVITEYRNNIGQGRLPGSNLSQLYSQLWGRLEIRTIAFDKDGYAILPEGIHFQDAADRKFLALALTGKPYAPIYNGLDTDWEEAKDAVKAFGITVVELCAVYIQGRLKGA